MHIIDLVIKYHDAVSLPALDDPLPLDDDGQTLWRDFEASGSAKFEIRRLFRAVLGEPLNALTATARGNAERAHSGYKPPSFENYLWVSCAAENGERDTSLKIAAELLRGFLKNERVQHAYIRLPDVPAESPLRRDAPSVPRANVASHLQSAPVGIGAVDVWRAGFGGARGEQQSLVDVEHGWCVDHEALLNARQAPRADIDPSNTAWMQRTELWAHGTRVLGVVCGRRPANAEAIGIAPEVARVRLISTWRDDSLSARLTTAEAIVVAAANVVAASQRLTAVLTEQQHLRDSSYKNAVILITLAAQLPEQSYLFPVEIYPDTFDAIELVTLANCTVVEPTGNGVQVGPGGLISGRALSSAGVDFDQLEKFMFDSDLMPKQRDGTWPIKFLNPDAAKNAKNKAKKRFVPYQDSGAIMVAAAIPTAPNSEWTATRTSGRGARVDCFARGESVHSAHFNDRAPSTHDYTANFDATSSASAIIAGAALCVQGMAQARLGAPLSPTDLRIALRDPKNGTASKKTTRNAIKIGVMPDLQRIAKNVLGLP
jgi:serine protease